MHIIECDYEFSGFDDRLVKAGTSVYLWNLCRKFRAAGHRVTGLTPAHGLLGQLAGQHEITTLDWRYAAALPVALDPRIWPDHGGQAVLDVCVTAHRVTIAGIDIVFLAGGLLDEFTGSFYPPAGLEGRDLAFLKPLVFQAAAARYLADAVGRGAAAQGSAARGTVLHLHEPLYHYLIPAALAGRGLVTVSTVQTNMPVNTKVYGPQVRGLLKVLGGDPHIADGLTDPPVPAGLRQFLPGSLLAGELPELPGHDYVSLLGLVARSVSALDFLSAGQLEHALTQAGSPFEELFAGFAARRELLARRDRLFVGGCAIGDEWLSLERRPDRRRRILVREGLDPALPVIYHNARYTVQHKGQQEMFRALLRLLDSGEPVSALVHCLAPERPDDPDLDALERRHPDRVRIRTGPMTQPELIDWALASDLCLFPSKFEMDTFLMAMGEAMAAGAVPVATAQQGMRHFGHSFDLADPAATGLALPRSFGVDDPALTDAICAGVRRLLALMRDEPDRFAALRDRAVTVARQFTWQQTADRFTEIFTVVATTGVATTGVATTGVATTGAAGTGAAATHA